MIQRLLYLGLALCFGLPAAMAADESSWVHAYAAYGAPKYPRGFAHFDYVNPDAPKGGTLYLRNPDRRTSFDKFNPFTTRGSAPAGLSLFMLEPLALLSADEPQTMYGLLAEDMKIAPDKSSITFRLRRQARFYNGDPVTAADVKYSFDSLAGPFASPAIASAFSGVERAVILDEQSIRFDLKDRNNDMLFLLGGLTVFSRKWALEADGKPRQFDLIVSEYPITSGPYTVALAESGRRIEFKRNPQYWGSELGVRRGFFNFERVVYRYYKDNDVSREAFKAGEFDIYSEYSARSWRRLHQGPKWADGRIRKEKFPTAYGQGLQSYQFNLRRAKFQDIRVREAIGLTYDFDIIFRGSEYERAYSLFNNTEFAAVGLPAPAELALLEPFRASLPPAVFGPAFVAPRTHGQPAELRANLLRARSLFEAAGWKLDAAGVLRNAAGEPFEIEYLIPGEGGRRPAEWLQNLAKLGVTLKLREVDFALYQRRLDEYDFDMVAIAGGKFTLPAAVDFLSAFGSKAADQKGDGNYRGVKSAAVDSLIQAMSKATTLDELRTAARALDRVVMWSFWQVPDLYFASERASYWNKFERPALLPKYYSIESPSSDSPPWAVATWWFKASARR